MIDVNLDLFNFIILPHDLALIQPKQLEPIKLLCLITAQPNVVRGAKEGLAEKMGTFSLKLVLRNIFWILKISQDDRAANLSTGKNQ